VTNWISSSDPPEQVVFQSNAHFAAEAANIGARPGRLSAGVDLVDAVGCYPVGVSKTQNRASDPWIIQQRDLIEDGLQQDRADRNGQHHEGDEDGHRRVRAGHGLGGNPAVISQHAAIQLNFTFSLLTAYACSFRTRPVSIRRGHWPAWTQIGR